MLIAFLLFRGMESPAAESSRRFSVGRPLVAALSELKSEGLDIVYSSDLVRRSMRVLAEPVATTPRAILDELVIPHNLEARDGPAGTVLIVRAADTTGPPGGVAGRIVSAGDRRPMPGARVSGGPASSEIVAAADGRFLMLRLPPGAHDLDVVSSDGRRRSSVEVTIRAGVIAHVVIELSPELGLVEGVVVTPTLHSIVQEQPEARQTLDAGQLAALAHVGDDALRAAARLPGAAAGDKSARFSLRGGEWNETLVLVDGLEIDEPFHLKDFLAFSGIVNSRAIERTDLLAGGFPVEYGHRMSGVMEMTTSTSPERSHSAVGSSNLNTWFLTEGRTDTRDNRWLVAARAWYPDAVLDLVDPGGEDLNPTYYDLIGKFEAPFAGGAMISGHVLAARHQIQAVETELGDSVNARSTTTYAWMNLTTPWTTRLVSLTQLSTGRVESNRHGASTDGASSASVDDERVWDFAGARQDWTFRASDQALVKWGFDARDVGASYDYVGNFSIDDPLFTPPGSPLLVSRDIRANPSGSRFAAYAAARAQVIDSLTMEAGARWSRQSYTRDAQLDPRVNIVYAAGSRSTVRAAWGLFHQPQSISELQVEDGVGRFFPAQRAEHRVASFEHDTGAGTHFRIDAYWKVLSRPRPRFENLFNPIELLPESEADRIRVAPRRAVSKGLELLYERKQTPNLRWWAGYALSSAQDDVSGRWEPRSWDQTHAVNLGMSYQFGHGWEMDLAGVYHTGWPTTQVTADSALDPNGVLVIQPSIGPRNDRRFTPYHRLDVKVQRRMALPKGSLTLFLEVLNLYNRENACCVDEFRFVPTGGGGVRVERDEGSWLGWLPEFGLGWEF